MKCEKINFKYKSPENMCLMLMDITFEKSSYYKDYSIAWEIIFHGSNGEELIKSFLEKAYPQGALIGEKEINELFDMCMNYLRNSTDKKVRSAVNENIKKNNQLYVYSKYNDTVYPCGFARHTETVAKIIAEFFGKSLEDVTEDVVKKFVLSNCIVRSDNLTIEEIAKDVRALVINAASFVGW